MQKKTEKRRDFFFALIDENEVFQIFLEPMK